MTGVTLKGSSFWLVVELVALLAMATFVGGQQGRGGAAGRGQATPAQSLSDPVPNDPALVGAIDLHAHQDPDSNGPSYNLQSARSVDGIDLAKRAKAAGMRGFVVKQHLDQTAGLAYYLRKLYPDMEIFGGMGSNLTTGTKVNAWAVTHMAEMKGGWGRIVWMPSWDSEHTFRLSRGWPAGRPYVSVSKDNELLPEVREAIAVIAKTRTRDSNGELILATGHNSPQEVLMMIREAKRVGVRSIIVTHPLLESVGMNHEQMQEAAKLGAYLEFVSGFARGPRAAETTKEYVEAIRAVGVERSFVSSDLGQLTTPFPPDGLATAAKALRANGFTERELDVLFKENPARILGLPVTVPR
jgi:uncharacterized protein DUF6282